MYQQVQSIRQEDIGLKKMVASVDMTLAYYYSVVVFSFCVLLYFVL